MLVLSKQWTSKHSSAGVDKICEIIEFQYFSVCVCLCVCVPNIVSRLFGEIDYFRIPPVAFTICRSKAVVLVLLFVLWPSSCSLCCFACLSLFVVLL